MDSGERKEGHLGSTSIAARLKPDGAVPTLSEKKGKDEAYMSDITSCT